MIKIIRFTLPLFIALSLFSISYGNQTKDLADQKDVESGIHHGTENLKILISLIDLQKSLQKQIDHSKQKLSTSSSEAEKHSLESELIRLDNQLNEAKTDFERIATGVEEAVFAEKKPEAFSWKNELSTLVEPAIKELKRLTIRARQKTKLKDSITNYTKLTLIADKAVKHLQNLIDTAEEPNVKKQLNELAPEWLSIQNRLTKKRDLALLELERLKEQEISLVESSSKSMQGFFRERGLYLLVALLTFIGILILFSIFFRLFTKLFHGQKDKAFHIRLVSLIYKVSSFAVATFGLFLVLYLAEDWFLLSLAIIISIALMMTLRQGIPKLWQQGRLMLNVGSVREGERVVINNIAWKVEELNVFSVLANPSLKTKIRIPIENMIGLTSRPYNLEEPWFPCKKGDWVVINGKSRAKVVSQSPETVEVVERGGTRVFYNTADFISMSPSNLSRNFRIRIPFGIGYEHQEQVVSEIPDMLKEHIIKRFEEVGYTKHSLQLAVEFMQANDSSLDLMILADFSGEAADIQSRLKRFINRCCVEACTLHQWQIPYPHISLQLPNANGETNN